MASWKKGLRPVGLIAAAARARAAWSSSGSS
jgi:hypothetical protein